MPSTGKIIFAIELTRVRDQFEAQGKKLVFANGCFDLMHGGHIRYPAAAARAMVAPYQYPQHLSWSTSRCSLPPPGNPGGVKEGSRGLRAAIPPESETAESPRRGGRMLRSRDESGTPFRVWALLNLPCPNETHVTPRVLQRCLHSKSPSTPRSAMARRESA